MVDQETVEKEDQIEDGDLIDEAFSDMLQEFLPKEPSEDDWDELSDDLYDVIESIEDEGLITGIPEEDATDEDKQKWVDAYLPVIRDKFNELRSDSPLPSNPEV